MENISCTTISATGIIFPHVRSLETGVQPLPRRPSGHGRSQHPRSPPIVRPVALLAEFGRRLAAVRREQGLSVAELAARAGVSLRYLRLAESGAANLSLLKLAALANALRLPLATLCDLPLASAPELRIALLGVRGSGKSTVGRALARRLEVPFHELDELIEQRAGISLADVFTIHGEGLYRDLQRETLEEWLAQNGSGVLATGGSVVNDPLAYDRLRGTCRTVWLQASAEEHWRRVVGQGDRRPMESRPRAMLELRGLLAERAPRYALADLALDTEGESPETLAARIATWALAEGLKASY